MRRQKYDDGLIKFISADDRKIYVKDDASLPVLRKSTADIMTYALKNTAADGTAKTLSALPFQVAAKTGTAQRADGNNSDAWCASYNQEYTVVVWHGSAKGMSEKGGGLPTKQCLAVWKEIENCTHSLKTLNIVTTLPLAILTLMPLKRTNRLCLQAQIPQ